jgi:hypothetical protein
MSLLSIATADASKYAESLRARLTRASRFLKNEGLGLDISESSKGRFIFLGCNIEKKPQSKLSPQDAVVLFKHFMANTLSDFIVDDVEEALIRKIIRQNYCYFSSEEQDHIFAAVEKELDAGESKPSGKTSGSGGSGGSDGKAAGKEKTRRIHRKAKILNVVLDYLTANELLVVEGFVTFRLKEYLDELEETVDQAVDEYLLEREYQEFIKLLKYFVDMQEPKITRVKVYLERDGTFTIRDELGKQVATAIMDEITVTMIEGGLEYEDLLVSSLIMLAPREIWVHSKDQERWSGGLQTLASVFGERVKLCNGCPWCHGDNPSDGGGI